MSIDVVHVLIMAFAVGVGVAVRRLVRAPSDLGRAQSIGIALAAVIGGVIGAKLPFLFSSIETLRSFDIWLSDGRTITWALAGGYMAVEAAKLSLGVRSKTGDSFAAPVAASIAVGRVGCFQGGCCYGRASGVPWAVDFGDAVLRHPTQLYEAVFHGMAAIFLVWLNRRGVLRRQHFKLYLGSYCVYRFVTEWLRPEPTWWLGLTFYQVSVLVILFGVSAHFLWDAKARQC